MYSCDDYYENKGQKRLVVGLLLVAAGFLFFLKNMGILPYFIQNIVFSWQMLIIAIGVVTVTNPRKRTGGFVIMAIGLFFLVPKVFHVFPFFSANYWPIILIVAGLFFLLFPKKNKEYY